MASSTNQTIPSPLPTQSEIEKQPWKYTGYPKYSAWVASSDSFFHVRKFRTLNARVILALQDEIVILEEKLKTLDETYSLTTAGPINNGSFRDDQQLMRVETLNKIKLKLLEYSEWNSLEFYSAYLKKNTTEEAY